MDINESNFQENDVIDETPKEPQDSNLPKNWKYAQSHPKDLIIGDTSQGIKTRSLMRNLNNYLAFVS